MAVKGSDNGTLGAEQIQAIVAASIAAYQAQAPVPHSSVELVTDSKGTVKPTVKVYDSDPERAAATAKRIMADLTATYAKVDA